MTERDDTFFQQVIKGVMLGASYSLVAIGYTFSLWLFIDAGDAGNARTENE